MGQDQKTQKTEREILEARARLADHRQAVSDAIRAFVTASGQINAKKNQENPRPVESEGGDAD